MGKVTGAMITRIAADVHRYRATPPAIANTDGDPMCLISVTIAVGEGAVGKLAAHPDFVRDSDEPDRVTWWGAQIPDGQREAMMAEARAQLRAQGQKEAEAPEGPQRWVRGVLRVRGGEITVEVNSVQRLTRLVEILARSAPTRWLPRRSGSTRRSTSPAPLASTLPRAAPRPRPKAGRSSGSMGRFLRCSAGRPGRPHAAGSGRTWRQCCGNSSTRPTSSPQTARPASIPPGCASNSTCQATSPAERLDGAIAHPGRDYRRRRRSDA